LAIVVRRKVGGERFLDRLSGSVTRTWLSTSVLGLALLVIAGLLRFPTLGQRSLWLDETISWVIADHADARDVLQGTIIPWLNQSPLFFLSEWLLRPFGFSEFVLRLPSS
jgi:hypothetical protein